MKIIIPSYGRADTITTHKFLEDGGVTNYNILLHTEEHKKDYCRNPTIDPSKIIVSNADRGIANQRRWIIRNFAEKEEWFMTMDDNVRGIKGVSPKHYGKMKLNVTDPGFDKTIYDHEYNSTEFIELCHRDISIAEAINVKYCGFSTVPNYYFLAKKYRSVGYVISKIAIIKNMGLDYDLNLEAMEDFGFTAENLLHFGGVLINNFIIPRAGHYEKGGIGTYEERLPRKIKDCAYLMYKYPGLFRYKEKAGCHPMAELQIRFTNTKQLDEWRRSLNK